MKIKIINIDKVIKVKTYQLYVINICDINFDQI